jgi:glycosyltransferase involved in cell wall biosynthesis
MRVLMTADAAGGVFTYALTLVEGLAARGVETVLVLTGPPPDRAQRRRLTASPLAALEQRPYALEWMPDPWEDLVRADEWLAGLAASYRPDLVHLNGYVAAAAELGRPKIVVGHSCVLSWHEAVRRAPAGPEWTPYRAAVTAGIAAADALVAPTHTLLDTLRRLYRPTCRTLAIANAASPRSFSPERKEQLVVGVGRVWDEAKNLGALERVRDSVPARLVVAGEGSNQGRLDGEALRDLYGRAAIFAEPARYEPFGLAALEAGLAGCALVLGDIATLREVWGDAAAFVDPHDDEVLSATLRRLLVDDRERGRLARAARRRALSYSPERQAEAYLRLYREALAEVAEEAA